jgi:hypothetical protein
MTMSRSWLALEGRVELAHQLDRPRLLGADDDAVGTHEVLHRGALLEELRVGDDAEFGLQAARRQFLGNRRPHPVGGADRHGRLVHNRPVAVHVAADVARRRDDVLQVGRAVLVGRRADRDELQQAVPDAFGDVGGEAQAAGGAIARHHLLQARLVDRQAAGVEDADFLRVEVQAQHVVAHFRKAGAADEADVAGADDCDLQEWPLRVSDRILPCALADSFPRHRNPGSASRTAVP